MIFVQISRKYEKDLPEYILNKTVLSETTQYKQQIIRNKKKRKDKDEGSDDMK